ncbi:NuA4 histone H4 acetyltransferase complex and the SWR1 complex subunit, partial [Cryomyces antarcticus]
TRTGWGGFPIEIKLFFHPFAAERAHSRYHDLHLEPYGSDEKQAEQMRTGKVVAEVADFIEFNEPTEALFDALTSESQWDYLTQAGANNKAKGKGKGKGKGGKAAASARAALTTKDDEPERTAQLPQRSTPANPYSLDLEAQLIDMLRAREKELDALLAEEAVKRAA